MDVESTPEHSTVESHPTTPLDQIVVVPSPQGNPRVPGPATVRWDIGPDILYIAAETPLPASPRLREPGRIRSEIPAFGTYFRKVQQLTACLPHLKALWSQDARYTFSGHITCLDLLRTGDRKKFSSFKVEDMRSQADLQIRVHELRATVDSQASMRLVMVEDLCNDLIEALGSTFEIDPEFFAEHLNRSGYAGFDHEDDDEPRMWNTSHLDKSYRSVAWLRPVDQSAKVSEWLQEAEIILAAPTDEAQEILDVGVTKVPLPYYGNTKDTRQREARRLNGITWRDRGAALSREASIMPQTSHNVVPSTNIFRKCWTLPGKPQLRLDKDIQAGEYAESVEAMRQRTISTLWLEKASLYQFRDGPNAIPIVVLLLDPLPGLTDHRRYVDPQNYNVHVEPADVPMGLPVIPRSLHWGPPNKYLMSKAFIRSMKLSVDHCESTRSAIVGHVLSNGLDPYQALMAIIQTDFRATRDTLDRAFDQIAHDSLDDYLMTRDLASWRQLMNDLSLLLPVQLGNIVYLTNTLTPIGSTGLIQRLSAGISSEAGFIQARLRDAYASLRTDMQFTESRKSIAEAKSVAKLTELAFLFIPLSFTASLFSMSIQGLDSPVPVWIFAVTALAFVAVAYAARLLIASDFITDRSRKALERFWIERNVRRGQSVPVVTLFFLTARELVSEASKSEVPWMMAELLSTLPFMLVPIGIMWTSTTLGGGFNSALTLAVLLSQVAAYITLPMSSDFIAFSIKRSMLHRTFKQWAREARQLKKSNATSSGSSRAA